MDRGEVEAWYDKHASALVRFAATVVGPADAEDVVAAAVLSLLRSTTQPDDLRAYAYRTVLHEGRRHWRSTDRRRRRETLLTTPDRYEHVEYVPEVARSLSTLSPQQRAVIHLTYWEDLTPGQVAGRLGVSDGTVRRQLARARHRLAEVLHDEP